MSHGTVKAVLSGDTLLLMGELCPEEEAIIGTQSIYQVFLLTKTYTNSER